MGTFRTSMLPIPEKPDKMSEFKTFIDSKEIDKINEFYGGGFFAADTMLVMELILKDWELKAFDCESQIWTYDTSSLKEYLKANGKGFGDPDPIENVRAQLANPYSAIYVLRERGKIVSSVTTWDIDDKTVATENVFTIPKYRNRGYARAVLSTVLNVAWERKMERARLTVYAKDVPAIKMYFSLGYKITKVLEEFRHE